MRLLIFLQPLGRALKNQNAAPTTPPCFSRWLRSSLLLFESSRRTVNRSLLLDIPTDWEPRAKQSRTVALLAALCAAALFESSRRTVNRSLLLDIPTDWEPRAKQSRTVALLAALCAAALFESSRRTKALKKKNQNTSVFWFFLVRPGGFEPLAFRVGAERSIQLSYDRIH